MHSTQLQPPSPHRPSQPASHQAVPHQNDQRHRIPSPHRPHTDVHQAGQEVGNEEDDQSVAVDCFQKGWNGIGCRGREEEDLDEEIGEEEGGVVGCYPEDVREVCLDVNGRWRHEPQMAPNGKQVETYQSPRDGKVQVSK